ncbi:hypothetical protein NP233_g12819 [Leucocoprinus birnbaumii]|uniref:Uncharacterized protein n=1 Tax=Leucocoprinus birnbaumii TaxID=56174 RepID=A0AAD5YPP0_9AGAR|nr:hypothetical protein NP233_g12819 [Leucocoprinus birnbaumii]
MSVRSPMSSGGQQQQQQYYDPYQGYGHGAGHGPRTPSAASYASHTSYETAASEFWTAEGDGHGRSASAVGGSMSGYESATSQLPDMNQNRMSQMTARMPYERSSEETARGSEYVGGGDFDDGTVLGHGDGQQHDRRTSNMSVATWEMGRAL